jgi:cytochrome c oxidase cbb3-type subunit 3
VSKDTNRLLGHADEADGIEEYDNPLPDWWLGLLWFSIVWAFGYAVHYHFIADRSQVKELAAEMAAADLRWPAQAQAEIQFSMTDAAIEAGAPIYTQNCAPCHAAGLEGLIGPSFIDDEWIHGGTATDVLRTIREGVLDKGMVAWGGILSPEQINDVAAYVLSKHVEATGRSMDDILREPGEVGDPALDISGDTAVTGQSDAGASGGAG